MDLKTEAISYKTDTNEIRHVIGADGVISIVEDINTITITKTTGNIVLPKETLGNWTLHMYANVPPE